MTSESVKDVSHKRILIVDDQGSIRSVVNSYFKEMGFTNVFTAFDGKDALDFLSQREIDIIICDWQMPKISGFELLEKIRAHTNTQNLPFIMMTSTSDLENVKSAASVGVSDYLIKPFQPAQLGYKVVQLLSKSNYQAKRFTTDVEPLEPDNEETIDLGDFIDDEED